MSKTWKWVLGTVLVLVVVAAIVCSHTFFGGFMRNGLIERGMFQSNGWGDFYQHGQMMSGAYGNAGPGYMMRGHGFVSPMFGFGFMFLRGLVPLAFLGLLVYGAYRMGMKKPGTQVSTGVASSEMVAGTSEPTPVEGQTCRKCGGIVQEEWRNCPYCGTKQ